MGSGQTASADDQFSVVFGNRRGNPEAISVEDEVVVLDALHALQERSGNSLDPFRPALTILKATTRRDGLYAELAKVAQEREAQVETGAVGIKAACEFGIFDVTRPMVERWCAALYRHSVEQARTNASQTASSTSPRTPLLEWLHECEGLETVLADPTFKKGLFEQIKSFIGPEGWGEDYWSRVSFRAAEIWGELLADASVSWLEDQPRDPLLTSIISSGEDGKPLLAAVGGPLPRVADVLDHAELSKSFEALLDLVGPTRANPSVGISTTPPHLSFSSQVWPAYSVALLAA